MWLTDLEADRLRNLKAVSLGLPAGLTVVAGRNGQGKTSLLEAIYLLGTGRSFRSRRSGFQEELISWDGGPLRVAGKLSSRAGRSRLTVVLDGGERGLLVDGTPQELDGFIGRLGVVDLTAERMKVVSGGPEERRRFIDRGIVGLDPTYLWSLGEYRRVLSQRNALLRRGREPSAAEIAVWDERLAATAEEIHRRRREYLLQLSARLGEATRVLFPSEDGKHELTIHYKPSPAETREADIGRFKEILAKNLARAYRRDRALGHTFLGPHRDGVAVELDGIDLRRYGSAGQVRASMVALKLGKLSLVREDRGEAPLFLMDDFDTDLDEIRASALAGYLQEAGFQAIVATSKETMAERLGVAFMKILVHEGTARTAD